MLPPHKDLDVIDWLIVTVAVVFAAMLISVTLANCFSY